MLVAQLCLPCRFFSSQDASIDPFDGLMDSVSVHQLNSVNFRLILPSGFFRIRTIRYQFRQITIRAVVSRVTRVRFRLTIRRLTVASSSYPLRGRLWEYQRGLLRPYLV